MVTRLLSKAFRTPLLSVLLVSFTAILVIAAAIAWQRHRAEVIRIDTIGSNEQKALAFIQGIRAGEGAYKKIHGRYATVPVLEAVGLLELEKDPRSSYSVYVTLDRGVEALATPTIYGSTGLKSYYLARDGRIRSADHGGAPANCDDPVEGSDLAPPPDPSSRPGDCDR